MTQKKVKEPDTMTDPNDTHTADLLQTEPADDSQERSASLLQLERQAAALDQENTPPETAIQASEGNSRAAVTDPAKLAAQVSGMVGAVVTMLEPYLPSLGHIYTPETRQQLGAAVAPVMVKHGWNLGDVSEKYGEEIMLAMVVIPLGMATYQGVKGDIAAHRRAAQEQRQGDGAHVG